MKRLFLLLFLYQSLLASDNYYYKNNEKVTLTPKNSILRGDALIDYYDTDEGVSFGVSDKIIVKAKSYADVEKYCNDFNLSIEKELGVGLYLLKVSDKSLTIDISNRLSEKNDIEYAHPDFIKKRVRR
jgi:hypothetical protein